MNGVEQIKEEMAAMTLVAVEEWRAKNPPEVIEKRVFEMLDNSLNTIVPKLLGFNTHYRGSEGIRWEIDSCNGRAGDSAAGDYLRACARDSIKAWFDNIDMKKVDINLKELADSLYNQQRSRLQYESERLIKERMQDTLNQGIDLLFADLTPENILKDATELKQVLGDGHERI